MFVKNNNGLNGPHCVFCCFLFFFFPLLIHISDSGRGKLKSAVHCGVTSCLHWTGMKPCMVREVHLYFQGPPAHWARSWELPPAFLMQTCPAWACLWHLSVLWSWLCVPLSKGCIQKLCLIRTWSTKLISRSHGCILAG